MRCAITLRLHSEYGRSRIPAATLPNLAMKKVLTKYIYVITLVISFTTLIFFLLAYLSILLLSVNYIWQVAIFSLSSVLSAVVATIGLSVFSPPMSEVIFNSRRMSRFESLSSPILLKLSTEAPGTYHHSINVSNLAHKAAKDVGADSILVRTASYYHDIGKLTSPTFFIENQAQKEIPTDDSAASIRQSARKIIAHVADGVKTAQKHHLPPEIIDLIAQHHGTSRAVYFYEKAKERGLKIQKTDFRYTGPHPLSREAAILMLADSVEATARTLPRLSLENIRTIAENTIHEKLADGQLKNARLLEMDLAKIKQSFEATLLAIYHQRIDYHNSNES